MKGGQPAGCCTTSPGGRVTPSAEKQTDTRGPAMPRTSTAEQAPSDSKHRVPSALTKASLSLRSTWANGAVERRAPEKRFTICSSLTSPATNNAAARTATLHSERGQA